MNSTRRPSVRRITLLAALPLVGALALAGCSSDDDDTDDTSAAGGSAAATAPAASAPAASGTADRSASGAAASNDALVAAARTAVDAAGSGSLLSIEQDAGGSSWKVLVAGADGSEQEVFTDAAGRGVTAGPTPDDTDASDLAENTRFVEAADITPAKAASIMTNAVAGTVVELGLDDHAGAVVWEGDVVDSANTKHSIRIDAGSGDVVTNAVDTDD